MPAGLGSIVRAGGRGGQRDGDGSRRAGGAIRRGAVCGRVGGVQSLDSEKGWFSSVALGVHVVWGCPKFGQWRKGAAGWGGAGGRLPSHAVAGNAPAGVRGGSGGGGGAGRGGGARGVQSLDNGWAIEEGDDERCCPNFGQRVGDPAAWPTSRYARWSLSKLWTAGRLFEGHDDERCLRSGVAAVQSLDTTASLSRPALQRCPNFGQR